MQQFDVPLPTGVAFPENKEQLTLSLALLLDAGGAAETALASALQYENKPKFGPSAISNLRFEVAHYDLVSLRGRIRVLYDMQLTFGCEDVIKDHLNQHSYYNLQFNPGGGLFHFESDTPEMPTTAEEF
nr:hypothetical protein [Mucilaginibacter sp. L294]